MSANGQYVFACSRSTIVVWASVSKHAPCQSSFLLELKAVKRIGINPYFHCTIDVEKEDFIDIKATKMLWNCECLLSLFNNALHQEWCSDEYFLHARSQGAFFLHYSDSISKLHFISLSILSNLWHFSYKIQQMFLNFSGLSCELVLVMFFGFVHCKL